MNKTQSKSKEYFKEYFGFTLIETIFVILIIGIILPTIFSTLATTLRYLTSTKKASLVKGEGDNILGYIENKMLKERYSVITDKSNNKKCITEGSTFSVEINNLDNFIFKNENTNSTLQLRINASRLEIKENNSSYIPLTSTSVQIESIKLSCKKKFEDLPPFIYIYFKIKYKNSTQNTETLEYVKRGMLTESINL